MLMLLSLLEVVLKSLKHLLKSLKHVLKRRQQVHILKTISDRYDDILGDVFDVVDEIPMVSGAVESLVSILFDCSVEPIINERFIIFAACKALLMTIVELAGNVWLKSDVLKSSVLVVISVPK